MGDYTILHRAALMECIGSYFHTWPLPSHRPATAALSDGTFLVASKLYTAVGILIRLWHLSPTLVVLGTTDIDRFVSNAFTESWPVLVATSNNQALLVGAGEFFPSDHYYDNVYSWVIDCSAADPVVMTTHWFYVNDGVSADYEGYQHSALYDPATGRVLIGSFGPYLSILEVFNATTGERLAVGQAVTAGEDHSGYGCIGLYMDPSDSTHFTFIDPWVRQIGGGTFTKAFSFTVPLDGTSAVCTGAVVMPQDSNGWTLAGGSPYIPGGPGLIADDATSTNMEYYDPAGTVVLTSLHSYITWYGDMVSMGESVIAWFEEVASGGWSYGAPRQGFLYCVNESQPPTLQELALPYFGFSGGASNGSGGITSIAPHEESGVFLVASTVDADDHTGTSVLVWLVQGPVPKPNLTGGPLGVDVHFDPR